jgi:Spy/CpxP family protein refolding chaperone
MPPQRVKWREAEKLEATLSKVLKESVADVATVQEQVERLEKLQSERRAMRTVMLYRMNLVLTPEQRVKLEAFRKRREDNQRRQPDRRH